MRLQGHSISVPGYFCLCSSRPPLPPPLPPSTTASTCRSPRGMSLLLSIIRTISIMCGVIKQSNLIETGVMPRHFIINPTRQWLTTRAAATSTLTSRVHKAHDRPPRPGHDQCVLLLFHVLPFTPFLHSPTPLPASYSQRLRRADREYN